MTARHSTVASSPEAEAMGISVRILCLRIWIMGIIIFSARMGVMFGLTVCGLLTMLRVPALTAAIRATISQTSGCLTAGGSIWELTAGRRMRAWANGLRFRRQKPLIEVFQILLTVKLDANINIVDISE